MKKGRIQKGEDPKREMSRNPRGTSLFYLYGRRPGARTKVPPVGMGVCALPPGAIGWSELEPFLLKESHTPRISEAIHAF